MAQSVPQSDYAFYAGMLRFVAGKTAPVDDRVRAMLVVLSQAAEAFERQGRLAVGADRLEISARAFAGVAAFLQKQILPEVVAAGNATGERQIRWAIDTAMETVNRLLMAAARPQAGLSGPGTETTGPETTGPETTEPETTEIVLPPPPL